MSISSDYTAFTVAGIGLIVVLGVEQFALSHMAPRVEHATHSELTALSPNNTTHHNHKVTEIYGAIGSYSDGQTLLKTHCHHQHGVALIHTLNTTASTKQLITLYILELSIAIHSIVLGVSFGVQTEFKGVVVLSIALSVHQFIEGVAMGSMLMQYKDSIHKSTLASFLVIFSASISSGVVLGMISSIFCATTWFRFLQGLCGSVAAGTLLYVSLVEQLAVQFSREELERQEGVKLCMVAVFGLGFGLMALLTRWE